MSIRQLLPTYRHSSAQEFTLKAFSRIELVRGSSFCPSSWPLLVRSRPVFDRQVRKFPQNSFCLTTCVSPLSSCIYHESFTTHSISVLPLFTPITTYDVDIPKSPEKGSLCKRMYRESQQLRRKRCSIGRSRHKLYRAS